MIALAFIILVDLAVVLGLMYYGLKGSDNAKSASHGPTQPETTPTTVQPRQRED